MKFHCYTVHVVELLNYNTNHCTECTSVAGHSSQHNITQHCKHKSHISPTSLIICVQNYSNIYFDDTYLV